MSGPDEYHSVPHRPQQFNTSVPHQDHTFLALKIPQFHTKNLSVQHTSEFSRKTPSVLHQEPLSSTHSSVSNRLF